MEKKGQRGNPGGRKPDLAEGREGSGWEQARKSLFGEIRRMGRENKPAVFSLAVILLFGLAAVCAPILTPYTERDMDLMHRLAPPSGAHLLGTDEGGRDVLTRML